eukprot:3673487-Karenia_brevis.AAC.1
MIRLFIEQFDSELRGAFEEVVGLVLSDEQWAQSTLGIKSSGMGICSAARIADAAYLASRAQAYEHCVTLDGTHRWDDGRGGG